MDRNDRLHGATYQRDGTWRITCAGCAARVVRESEFEAQRIATRCGWHAFELGSLCHECLPDISRALELLERIDSVQKDDDDAGTQ